MVGAVLLMILGKNCTIKRQPGIIGYLRSRQSSDITSTIVHADKWRLKRKASTFWVQGPSATHYKPLDNKQHEELLIYALTQEQELPYLQYIWRDGVQNVPESITYTIL